MEEIPETITWKDIEEIIARAMKYIDDASVALDKALAACKIRDTDWIWQLADEAYTNATLGALIVDQLVKRIVESKEGAVRIE
jgi:hypothetical protein